MVWSPIFDVLAPAVGTQPVKPVLCPSPCELRVAPPKLGCPHRTWLNGRMVSANALYAKYRPMGESPCQQEGRSVELIFAGLLIQREPEQVLMQKSDAVDLIGSWVACGWRFHAATCRRSTRVLAVSGLSRSISRSPMPASDRTALYGASLSTMTEAQS